MIGTALSFKGLLSKSIAPEDIFKRFMARVEELRKVSSCNLEYLLTISRGIQFFNNYLTKQCESLRL